MEICPICAADELRVRFVVRGQPIFRCARCTCCFRPIWRASTEQLSSLQLAAFGSRYVRARRSIAPWVKLEARRTLRGVRRLAPPPGHLLEIGCATGEFCYCAQRAGYTVEGLEMSEAAAAFARARYGVPVLAGTIDGLAPGPRYNVVVAIHTLEHFAEPLSALRRIHDVLLPRGRLFIEVPSGTSWQVALMGDRSDVFTDEHVFFHSVESLGRLLARAQFKVLEVRSVEGYAGLFNAVLAKTGLQETIGRIVDRLRVSKSDCSAVQDPTPFPNGSMLQEADGASLREKLIDFGRSSLTGAAVVTGLAATPVRWALGAAGLGGALFGVAERTH